VESRICAIHAHLHGVYRQRPVNRHHVSVNDAAEPRRNSVVGGFAVLVVRGFLLWVVVPIATCSWMVMKVVGRVRGVTLGQFIGWCDINLIAGIQRSVMRPVVRWPADWVPASAMPEVTHRVSLLLDPV
jgi:hypothetical protein